MGAVWRDHEESQGGRLGGSPSTRPGWEPALCGSNSNHGVKDIFILTFTNEEEMEAFGDVTLCSETLAGARI